MTALRISEDVIPVGEFKTQASRVLRKLREHRRPVVITQNGKPAAVLITPEEFDRLGEFERFLKSVKEGIRDSDSGKLLEDSELTGLLDAEFPKL